MNRPYIVCAISTSVDGTIASPYFRLAETSKIISLFRSVKADYHCDAEIMGAGSAVNQWTGDYIRPDKLPYVKATVPRRDFIQPQEDKPWYPILCGANTLLSFEGRYIQKRGSGEQYLPLVILQESVPDSYLAYLQQQKVSYIFAGQCSFDARLCTGKLKEKFGINRLLISGGGKINYTFLQAGLIDEYCQMIFPFTDGASDVPKAFDRISPNMGEDPIVRFRLIEVREMNFGCVLLRYHPENTATF